MERANRACGVVLLSISIAAASFSAACKRDAEESVEEEDALVPVPAPVKPAIDPVEKPRPAGTTTTDTTSPAEPTPPPPVEKAPSDSKDVLSQLVGCLDPEKFDEIDFASLVTMPRTAANNPGGQVEDVNTCTGCRTTCTTCHNADAATGFTLLTNGEAFDSERTFEETKKTTPPYLQKYFAVTADGKPAPSRAIREKSRATFAGKAYSHPLFVLPSDVESRIDAFVNDALVKFNTGECGK